MDIGSIIGLATTGSALLGTAITLGYKLYTALKMIVKDKNWKKITQIAMTAITAAEKSGKSGADKKTQAKEAVKTGCLELNIDIAPFLDDLDKYIDDLVNFSKTVNI